MAGQVPRVAFFPDSFHEVNGVAHTSRHFERFAVERNLPFLCVRAGNGNPSVRKQGHAWTLELPRSAFSIPLEMDLTFDPAYLRHIPLADETLERFAPDIIHITGPSDVGLLGASLARCYKIPLAASWHTNVHEYAGQRFRHLLGTLWQTSSVVSMRNIEECAMRIAVYFYSAAQILFAPNSQLCKQLEEATGRPCHLMRRGVDCTLFSPKKRERETSDRRILLGFVGRLSVEKNVRMLAQVQSELESLGRSDFRFIVVGHGEEEEWLRRSLPGAEFTGVLKGEALSTAYANMDLFVFPSHTDTFGNVVLEALASGVPAIVTPDGGPASIVRDGQTGRVVRDEQIASTIMEMLDDTPSHRQMRIAARRDAMAATWDSVFEDVYRKYIHLLAKSPDTSFRLI